jgi:hypothetical protein
MINCYDIKASFNDRFGTIIVIFQDNLSRSLAYRSFSTSYQVLLSSNLIHFRFLSYNSESKALIFDEFDSLTF